LSEALKAVILILVLGHTPGANAFGAQGATASPAVRVVGVVLDIAGSPVRGAEVSLTVGRSAPRRVSTGDDGRFAFDGVRSRAARISARRATTARNSNATAPKAGGGRRRLEARARRDVDPPRILQLSGLRPELHSRLRRPRQRNSHAQPARPLSGRRVSRTVVARLRRSSTAPSARPRSTSCIERFASGTS
jgi:hypothetical protein